MAAIYDYDSGNAITDGLQGCTICDEAIQMAHRMAKQRNKPVILDDDDGSWIIWPDGSTEGTDH